MDVVTGTWVRAAPTMYPGWGMKRLGAALMGMKRLGAALLRRTWGCW